MNVFELRDRLVDDYRKYTRSFIKIRDPRIKEFVDGHLGAEGFWPEPLLQLNPAFQPGGTIDDLVAEGRGTIKMRAGLPAPEIEDAGGCVTVRFKQGTYVPSRVEREVTDRQQAILALLAGVSDGLALREITSQPDNSPTQRQVQDDLRILRTLGLAISTGHGRGARWKRQ